MSHKNIIGIDLGTTMSAIAKLNELGIPEIIPNNDGERIMPSVIKFSKNSLLIGEEAKNSAADEPERVAKEFKREMNNPDYRFSVDGKEYAAHELSSMILKKLVQDASEKIGAIKQVVITVPAYFKDSQRNATIEAGKLAGLDVIAIINEPTAAALFYAKESNIQGKGIVYDLGGGTFDITLTQTDGNNIKVLASEGDSRLGGVDFDKIVLDIMQEKYKEQINEELCNDAESREEFSLMAEDIKKTLSKKDVVKKKIRGDSGSATIEISRSEFEDKASTLIARTEMLLEQLLDETNTKVTDIDYVLLVGGSTRIPAIRKSIKGIFGKEPLNVVNVDEVVALGAAIKAGMVMINKSPAVVSQSVKSGLGELVVQDVANHSYGIVFFDVNKQEDYNQIIIKKNTPIPCVKTTNGSPVYDNLEGINIKVTQGEGTDIEYVDIIDSFTLPLPPGTPAGDNCKYTYSYDENQIMHCKAEHIRSGNTAESSVRVQSGKRNITNTAQEVDTNPLDEFLIE